MTSMTPEAIKEMKSTLELYMTTMAKYDLAFVSNFISHGISPNDAVEAVATNHEKIAKELRNSNAKRPVQ